MRHLLTDAAGLLGLLAADAGRVVSVDRLLTELWGDRPGVRAVVAAGVRLPPAASPRRHSRGDPTAMPPVRIRRRAPGYLLELPDGALDAWRLTRLAEAARARVTSDPAGALALLDEGLALVTGEPLGDVVDALGPVAAAEAHRLGDLVLRAEETRVEALLGVGRASDAATAAEHLLAGQPLRESLHALRLLALYRSGRQTDALAAYQALREQLSDEVGVDPGPALRRLHAQLLQQDPALDWSPPRTSAVGGGIAPDPAGAAGGSPAGGAARHCWVGSASWPSSRRPCAGARRATAGSGCCRARPASARPGWRRRWPRGRGRPARRWPSARRTRPATARRTGRGVRSSATSRASLAMVRPASSWGRRAPADGSNLTQAALHEAVADLLVDEARRSGPLLVVLEDLHWADDASLALLSALAERVRDVPLMLLCTYRAEDAEPAGAFGAMLARLARTPVTERLRLTGLTDETSRDLLADRLGWQPDEALAARAAARTAGNPFFLQELARLVRDSDDPRLAWDDIPGTVHDVLTHRLSRLPVEARRLLDVAAVVGRDCELGLLEAVAGLPPEDVDSGLAAAVPSGLATEIGSPVPVLHFQHALIREALYAQLGARARMRLHAAVGAAMSVRPEVDVDDLAYQLHGGRRPRRARARRSPPRRGRWTGR